MDREELFEEFINECEKEPLTFCGQGNPLGDFGDWCRPVYQADG